MYITLQKPDRIHYFKIFYFTSENIFQNIIVSAKLNYHIKHNLLFILEISYQFKFYIVKIINIPSQIKQQTIFLSVIPKKKTEKYVPKSSCFLLFWSHLSLQVVVVHQRFFKTCAASLMSILKTEQF